MVNKLDNMKPTFLPDHVGWRLWQASHDWKARFDQAMMAAGYPVFGEARSILFGHLAPKGTRQTVLAARIGLSKQAVQQFIDALVADGFVMRTADPDDARGRIIAYTEAGLKMLSISNSIKLEIEADYRAFLGTELFAGLMQALTRLNELPSPR